MVSAAKATIEKERHRLSPGLQIQLLGEFCILHGGVPLGGVDSARLQSLLGYLILHRDAPQPRAHLAFSFWPDSTESQARTNLRKQIYYLRQELPEADRYVQADARTVQWLPEAPAEVDVVAFGQALARANQAEAEGRQPAVLTALKDAVQLYQGDLLPGLYDDWVMAEREALRQQFLSASERLITALEGERAYKEAIEQAQRLLRHDPLHEATYRRLMRLYALDGDRARALHTYHACATVLERELEVEPSPETVEAHERLLKLEDETPHPRGRLASAPPLVGREEEWKLLQATWQAAARGTAQLALLTGEPGIGKTRLADELVGWASQQGIANARARCYASEGRAAFGPLVSWLRSESVQHVLLSLEEVWLRELARLLPEVAARQPSLAAPEPLTERWQQQRFLEALAQPFLACRKLVLHLDDVQWCDADTLDWLPFLLHAETRAAGRSRHQSQLLLVVTLSGREDAPGSQWTSLLMDLRRGRQLTEIALQPLSQAAVASLAGRVAGQALGQDLASELYRETEGNPLFVVETVRAGIPARQDAPAAPMAEPQGRWQTPPAVQEVISMRLSRLSGTARELAGVASVIGRQFSYEVLARASRTDDDALVRGLDELWQQRIVREQGADAYDFSHDKIREVALTRLSQSRSRLIHRQVAKALEEMHYPDLDAASSLIAAHLVQGGAAEEAIPHYQRAAAVARRVYAHADAVAYYERLLGAELRPHLTPAVAGEALLGLAELQRRTGDWPEAVAHCERALAIAQQSDDQALRAESQRALADVLRLQGAYDRALELLERAGDGFFDVGDREGAERVFGTMGEVYWLQGEFDLALAALQRQLHLASELGDLAGMCDAASAMGMVAQSQGNYSLAEMRCLQAITLAEQVGRSWTLSRAQVTMGNVCYSRGELDEAWNWQVRALDVARASGDRQCTGWAIANIGLLYLARAATDRAQACFLAGLETCLQIGDRWSLSQGLANLAQASADMGRDQEAVQHYRQAIAVGRALNVNYLRSTLLDYAQYLARQGSHAEARALTGEVLGMERASRVGRGGDELRLRAQILMACLDAALGKTQSAAAVASLRQLLEAGLSSRAEAAVRYELWKLEPADEQEHQRAADLYRELYETSPDLALAQRYAELTGEVLPSPPPFPELPEADPQRGPDRRALLEEVGRLVAEIAGDGMD
jgi:DNA-binding SARP family transcriptional activator